MSLAEWSEREFSDASRPHIATLRRMARDGDVPGAVQTTGHRWFVIVDEPSSDIQNRLRTLAGDDPIMKKAMGL